jgi:hypothetical protein
MKRLIALLLILIPVVLLAQDEVPIIDNWTGLYENFFTFMATWVGVAAIALFVGEALIRLGKVAKTFWKKTIIILLSIGVSFLGMVANIGYLSEAVWYETAIWGVASGLLASGIWTQNFAFLKTLVELLLSFLKKEPTE